MKPSKGTTLSQGTTLFKGATFALCITAAFALLCLAALPARAEVKLPGVFSDHMVLQRDLPVWVWGLADPGEEILVKLGGHETHLTADAKGRWKVKLPAQKAGGPFEMVVQGKNRILIKDILVGEVWVCSGQSNMEWPMSSSDNADQAIAAANHPKMRLIELPRDPSGLPLFEVHAAWTPCTPDMVKDFTAVGYFFGRALHRELDVPVGLIDTTWGGTRIEPWTPPEGFAAVPELRDILDRIDGADRAYRQALVSVLDPLEDWIMSTRFALGTGQALPLMPDLPRHALDHQGQPTGLYNGMVHPLVPFAIRGAIWYQGEANRLDGMAYRDKMKALISGWRTVWNQGDFPFYYVQLAPFRYREDPTFLAKLWEAQRATLSVPNTGMAVINDIGNLNDIHPRNKLDVGERLARWALVKTYGKTGMVYSGPLYRSMTVEGGKVRVQFDHTGSGLASRDGKALTWFEVAGADQEFVKAMAEIDGETVLVWSDQVAKPAVVRFAWHQEAEPNLMNKEKLPAPAFHTGKW